MPNENLFYFVRFSIFHQKSTFNFSWNYVRFRRFFEFFQFNFPRNYVRFRRFLQKNFFTFIKDFREKIFLLKVKNNVQNENTIRNASTTRKTGILYVLLKNVHYSKTYI